jgi:photosystem II stability/assembly factor-like uncharacterized protein
MNHFKKQLNLFILILKIKKIKLISNITVLLIFINPITFSQGWVTQTSGTASTLVTASIIDENIGYVLGNTVYKTTNGGLNWVPLSFGSGELFAAMDFVNANTGYVSAFDTNGIVYKTTNGGNSWTSAPVLLGTSTRMFFLNANQGYIVGVAGVIFATFTGGNLWIPQLSNTTNTLLGVYFVNSLTGWVCGFNGTILKTTNGGISWFELTSGTTTILRDIYFINSNTGFACGLNSRLYKTTNGGSNWDELYFNSSCGLNTVYFANDQTGWVAGCTGIIDATTNGGINWVRQSSGTTTNLNSLSFINSSTGWAVGFNGRILKTTNGGITFSQPISSNIPVKFELFQNYPNPFNPVTAISFSVPSYSEINITLFNISGEKIRTIINNNFPEGTYQVNFDGRDLSSGVYFYTLQALTYNNKTYSDTKRMILLK